MELIVKNLKILSFVITLATFSVLISMERPAIESENIPKVETIVRVETKKEEQVARPTSSNVDIANLGDFGKLPDDVILNIALNLLNQTDPRKAYKDFVNLSKTNKYINQLLNAAASERDLGPKIKKIKEEARGLIDDIANMKKHFDIKALKKLAVTSSNIHNEEAHSAVDTASVYWLKYNLKKLNLDTKELTHLLYIAMTSMNKAKQDQVLDFKKASKYLEIIKMLIDGGADVDFTSVNMSLLYSSFIWGFKDTVAKILLENGAVVDARTSDLASKNPQIKKFIEDNKKEKSQSGKQEE